MIGLLRRLFALQVIASCGHKTHTKGNVTAFGQTITMKMSPREDGTYDWCLACVAKMAIRCAWCKKVIHVGSPITLYTPTKKDFVVTDEMTVYRTAPLQLVGCLGWDCADTGADRAGFWMPSETGVGEVQRVMSPIEAAFFGNKAVVVDDLGSVPEAMKIQKEVLGK